ncbi:hypothetical protein ABW19_dt0209929 [Dactylella cylindrospora]|nr:hypothetical protein ABW19_dt0209929 [Dactylella cylindrospora]
MRTPILIYILSILLTHYIVSISALPSGLIRRTRINEPATATSDPNPPTLENPLIPRAVFYAGRPLNVRVRQKYKKLRAKAKDRAKAYGERYKKNGVKGLLKKPKAPPKYISAPLGPDGKPMNAVERPVESLNLIGPPAVQRGKRLRMDSDRAIRRGVQEDGPFWTYPQKGKADKGGPFISTAKLDPGQSRGDPGRKEGKDAGPFYVHRFADKESKDPKKTITDFSHDVSVKDGIIYVNSFNKAKAIQTKKKENVPLWGKAMASSWGRDTKEVSAVGRFNELQVVKGNTGNDRSLEIVLNELKRRSGRPDTGTFTYNRNLPGQADDFNLLLSTDFCTGIEIMLMSYSKLFGGRQISSISFTRSPVSGHWDVTLNIGKPSAPELPPLAPIDTRMDLDFFPNSPPLRQDMPVERPGSSSSSSSVRSDGEDPESPPPLPRRPAQDTPVERPGSSSSSFRSAWEDLESPPPLPPRPPKDTPVEGSSSSSSSVRSDGSDPDEPPLVPPQRQDTPVEGSSSSGSPGSSIRSGGSSQKTKQSSRFTEHIDDL